jgi:hypothetical protein
MEEGGYMIPDQPLKGEGDQDIIRGQMSCEEKEPSSMDKGTLKQCIKGVVNSEAIEVTMLDNMSAGEGDMVVEGEAQLMNTWKPCTKNTSTKGATLQATRQSQRLRNQGAISVEEMATKRKKKQNLEMSGNKNNPFIVLNNIDNDDLIQNAKDLDISLAGDETGQKEQINAMKAEELLRSHLAEVEYQAHLENLKLKERVHEDDGIDLSIIDNNHRGLEQSYDPV